MQIIISGLMIKYDTYGAEHDRTVLLLHGWGDRASGVKGLAQILAHAHFRVIVPDLPGFGDSDSPENPWGLDDYATCISQLLEKTNDTAYAIIGHSNGGAIAIRGLANGTLHAQKLILLASAGIRSDNQGKKKVVRLLAKSAKIATAVLPSSARSAVKKRAYEAIGSDLFVAEHMQETFKKIIADDVMNDAAKIRIPTLLVYGNEDTATPVLYGERFAAEILNSELRVVPAAGHFVHIDAADTVNVYVCEFLR